MVIYGFMAEGISYVAPICCVKGAAWVSQPRQPCAKAMGSPGRWAGPGAIISPKREAQLWPVTDCAFMLKP